MQVATSLADSTTLVRVLEYRKLRILAIGLGGAVLASLAATCLPVKYAANGLLLAGDPASSSTQVSDRLTETDILRSNALLLAVAKDLSLSDRPGLIPRFHLPSFVARVTHQSGLGRQPTLGLDAATKYLETHLMVAGTEGSRVLSIGIEAGEPGLAASIVNDTMRLYVNQDIARMQYDADRASEALRAQAAIVERDAEAADLRVQNFRSSHSLLMLEAGSTKVLQLSTLQSQLAAAQLVLAQAQASVHGGGSNTVSSSRELQSSPVIQALLERETEILAQIGNAGDVGDRNPRRLDLDQELAAVRARLETATRTVSAVMRRDVEVDQLRVASLQTAVEQAEAEAQGSGAAQIELARLSRAADTSHTLYASLIEQAEEAQVSASRLKQVRIISPATVPRLPQASKLPTLTVLGLLGGLVIAAILVLLRHLIAARIGSPQSLSIMTGLPSVGSLPRLRGRRAIAASIRRAEHGLQHLAFTETLRGMRVALQNRPEFGDAPLSTVGRCILVTSADLGEGKTSLAATLADQAAHDDVRVLLIEADLRRPGLGKILDASPGPGLEDVLAGRTDIASSLQVVRSSSLHCILSKGTHAKSFSLLGSRRFGELMAFARQNYELVVIDSPPATRVSDPIVLSQWVDTVLFAVKAEDTPLSLVLDALGRFPASQQAKIVTVLTHAKSTRHGALGSYAGYEGAGFVPAMITAPSRSDDASIVAAKRFWS